MALSSADVPTIYSYLQNALLQDETIRKGAELSLEANASRPGFCSCLLEIVTAQELDEQGTARWLAAVYFKNSINRFWRTRKDSQGIGNEEKPHLRAKLLELLRDGNNQVAVQLALLIAKIARFDYPREWPELFPSLIQKLQIPDTLITQRVYLVLNQVLKELSTKRLGIDQRQFAEVSSQLFDHTWHHWYSDTQNLMKTLALIVSSGREGAMSPEDQQEFSLTCERWLLCCKSLRRMLIFGFPSDFKSIQEVPVVQRVIPAYLQALQSLLQFWLALQQQHATLQLFLEKSCIKLMKSLIDVQATHPYSFSKEELMWPALEFSFVQVTNGQKGGKQLFEQFLIQCMILLQNILKCVAYKQVKVGRVVGSSTPTLQESKARLSEQAQQLCHRFFDNNRVIFLCDVLVQRYFMLTEADLENWDQDSEEFHHEQDQIQLRDKLRPCAEALYLVLFENFKEALAPVVMQMLKQASEACPPPGPESDVVMTQALLIKDACYDAVGVASYDLHDFVDFDSWYRSVLVLELANRHPNGRILRRRVAWLLGQWVSKIKDGLRREAYSGLINLLQDGDLAVQLASCRSLRTLIDDVHFYEEDFVDFVDPSLQLLFQMMQSAKEFDSQLQILNLVSLIIDRLGERIVPCADKIMIFLPKVWDAADGQSLLRIQVMLALQRLLISLGPRSPLCYKLLFPILTYSTDISQPDELNMLEDGMQLWQAALRHAPNMVPQFMHLFHHLVPIMERNFDHLLVAMKIIESYILIGGGEFLHHHGQSVVKIFDAVVGNVNEKGVMVTLGVIDTLLQCFPSEAPSVLEQALQKLLYIVIAGQSDSDLVKATAACVLARVLLQNSAYFARLLSLPSTAALVQQQSLAAGGKATLFLFVDAWLEKMDSVSSVAKRKLSALALSVLLTINESQLLDRLEQIVSACTGVLHETEGDKGSGASLGYDYWAADASEDSSTETSESEYMRRRQVFAADPVNSMSVGPLLREKLQVCAAIHGDAAFTAAVARLHPAILAQLQPILQA